ncbi:phospholipase A2 inhibitor and Ly6/PLAUR domain-containing protein-like isoform X3 [Xyrauchen texanus]|uniref:phospholipase A2 inhibitor and Ly6/PLAUR domain-containing protein-like isoform X3 n=1 Tax=Xyrauchen texanus TaxID=154827 RepID=UPI002241F3E3|nr:phospholipase A2 inhibitor and Ly6/PLAUR domain-containing protein-like isoform X3 [Xyrauchen texanus]
MDLQVSFVLLFILFTGGYSLNCKTCIPDQTGTCVEQTETCLSGFSVCSSVKVTGVSTVDMKIKTCAQPNDCQTGFMNLGDIKISSSCCSTDNCNDKDAPDLSSTPNGKQCYTCNGPNCSNLLKCSGNEDYCIKASGSFGGVSATVKGCVSKSVCDAATSIPNVANVTCCQGNLCNSATLIPNVANVTCLQGKPCNSATPIPNVANVTCLQGKPCNSATPIPNVANVTCLQGKPCNSATPIPNVANVTCLQGKPCNSATPIPNVANVTCLQGKPCNSATPIPNVANVTCLQGKPCNSAKSFTQSFMLSLLPLFSYTLFH